MKRYTGRPFPPYRHEPGRTPHPERSHEGYRYQKEWEPGDAPLTKTDWRHNDDYLYGLDLFNAGYFWEAHAVWEALWAVADADDMRLFLQSLIQLAAGCLKRSTGQPKGATKLFGAARSRLERLAEVSPMMAGIDLVALALTVAAESPERGAIHIVLQS